MKSLVLFIGGLMVLHLPYAQNYSLNGNAQAVGANCVAVTPNQPWQNGSVWYTDLLDLTQPFTLEFQMNYGTVDANGADGMMFVLQNIGPDALGEDGAGLGFQGFNPAFGIEFDTYYNSDFADIPADHVAFQRNGNTNHSWTNNLAGPVSAHPFGQNIEDGQEHPIKITWNPVSRIVQLYFDCVLRLSAQVDLVNTIFNGNSQVWWGFTGATGGLSNAQLVCLAETYEFNDNLEFTICEGESVQISANGNPEGNYSWLPTDGLSNSFLQSPVASPTTSTEYCYTYTDVCSNVTNGCIQVNVEAPPMVSAGDDDFYCAGEQYILQGSCDQPGAGIQWTNQSGIVVSDGSNLNPAVNSPGNYTITGTTPIGQCSSSDDVIIIENPLPVTTFDLVVTKCVYDSVTMDVGNTWQSITWYDGSIEPTLVAYSPGSYDVVIEENDCQLEVTIEVQDIILPDINLGDDLFFCEGETVYIDASVVVLWNTGLSDATLPVTTAGEYSAEVELLGCYNRDTILVESIPVPIVEAVDDDVFCEDSEYLISGSADQADVLYQWTLPNGNQTNFSANSSLLADLPGVYTLTAVNQLTSCAGSDAVELEEIPLPVPNFDLLVEKCSYDEIILDVGDSWDSVLWSDGSTENTFVAEEQGNYPVTIEESNCAITVDIQVQDIFPVSVNLGLDREICLGDNTLLNAGFPVEWQDGSVSSNHLAIAEGEYYALSYLQGCFVSDTVNVNIISPISLGLTSDTVLCEGTSLILRSNYSGVWSTGDIDNAILVDQPGIFSILVNQGPCVVRDSVTVGMLLLPSVTIDAYERYCKGESYELQALAEHGDYYTWSTGDTTSSIQVSESMMVSVETGNACGISMNSVDVLFEDCSAMIYMPTSFTPNGDGINDQFWPVISNVKSYELTIYDRWGRSVFSSRDYSDPWLGNTREGNYFVPNGQYNYHLLCTTEAGNAIERRGYILVVR